MDKIDIKNLTLEEIKKEMKRFYVPSYRAGQLFDWIYKRLALEFRDMSNLPLGFREKLDRYYYIGRMKLKERLKSGDGTEKFLLELSDGNFIESVLISARARNTLCISTQVGCKYGCIFCASGTRGFVRDLSSSEITGQVLAAQEITGKRITNLVFMGMGEPLDNYENMASSILIMNSQEGLGIGARKITLSTCGVIPGIEKLASLGLQVNLSISLHAADNKKRDALMPVNKKFPLERLIKACALFAEETGRKITLEYVLIKDKNDSIVDADLLSCVARKLKAKVNLIPYSPVRCKSFESPSGKTINQFKDRLLRNKINVTVRDSKGKDIQAACGQLAIKQNFF